jgi:hypothetical protein
MSTLHSLSWVRPQLIVVNLLLLPEYFCLFALEFANLCMGIQLINILELFTSSQPDQVLWEPDIQQKYGSIPLLSKCQVHSVDPYYQYMYSTFFVNIISNIPKFISYMTV